MRSMNITGTVISFLYRQPLWVVAVMMLAWILLWTGLMVSVSGRKKLTRISKAPLVLNGILLLVSLYMIFRMTLYNRKPYTDLYDFRPLSVLWGVRKPGDYWQVMFFNVLLFLPLGTSLPYCLSRKQGKPVLLSIVLIFLLSVIIETIQLLFGTGVCETDDVLCNTAGGCMGTLSYVIYKEFIKLKNRTA